MYYFLQGIHRKVRKIIIFIVALFHSKIILTYPFSVLQDFCKLALDYLQKGPNTKLYNAAARK